MAIPTDGLVFYAPLAEDKATAETGQTLNVTGSISYQSIDGIPCAYFNGESYLSGDDSAFPTGTAPFTVSLFCKLVSEQPSQWATIFHFGENSSYKTFQIHTNPDVSLVVAEITHSVTLAAEIAAPLEKMTHILAIFDGSKLSIYKSGVFEKEVTTSNVNIQNGSFMIGKGISNSQQYPSECYVSSVRVYNRVLSGSEISALANEFNQSGGGGDDSGTTGFILNGLFLSSSKPKLGQKGLLLDNKYFLPLVEGGGSAEYYRCASVDTSAKTWTGYRAVLNDGVYTFEDTVTSGLSYTSVTPQVGKIYSADALVYGANLYQGIPVDGLVFYAPLAEDKATAETGQKFTKTGTIEFSVQEGIPCAYFNGSSFLKTTDAGFPTGKNPVTISFWAKQLGGNGFFSYGKINQLYSGLWLTLNNNTANSVCAVINFWGIFYRFGNSALDDKFHHFCIGIMPNEDSGVFYLDGIEQSVSLAANSTPGKSFDDVSIQLSGTMEIGSYNDPQEGRKYLDGYLSAFRVYNRTLGKVEIHALAEEFTPTQVNT